MVKHTSIMSRFLVVIILVLTGNFSYATKIIVSQSEGTLEGNGSSDNPCLTITQAVELAAEGDLIYLKDGIFRETVKITKSGITITTDNEDVFITGTDLFEEFSDTGNGIYKTYAPNEVTQLFVNGIPQVRAKYPNQNVNDNLFNFTTINANFSGNSITSNEITQPDNFFNGATVWFLTGHRWVAGTAKVTTHTGNTLNLTNISINYQGDGIAFISNCKNCLDSDGEWYWGNDTLYYKNSNIDITNSKVEAKTRETLISVKMAENIKINGVNGYAGNILFDNTKGCKLSNGNFKYLTDYDYIKKGSSYARASAGNIKSYGLGVALFGVGDTVSNCEISWSAGDCITQYGLKNIVLRSTIHDANYRATDCSAVTICGFQNKILRCEIYNAGRDLISAGNAGRFKIKYNKLYRCGLLAWDLGIIYTWGADGDNGEIAFNHISQAYSGNPDPTWGAVGVYLDNGSRNYLVHHNVIHDIKGMGIQYNYPAYNLRSYNNTIFRTIRNMGFVGSDKPGFTVGKCKMYNNYSDKKLLNNSWVESKKNVVRNIDYLQDRDNGNYMLKPNSAMIDFGMDVDELSNIPFSGKAPDVGAYEYGRVPWTVGPDSKIEVANDYYYLKDTTGNILRGTPMVLGKNLSESVNFATDVNNWKTIKNNGFNTIRVCWVDPWYKDRGEDNWTVSEVLPYFDKCVQNATETGMNVIINFHNVNAQQNYDTDFNFEFEKEFWDSIAPRYKDNELVLYEIVSEPTSKLSDYLKPAFKQNLLDIYKTIRVAAPNREILMFSFGSITTDLIDIVKQYKDSIDWDKTSVAYHMYNNNDSYSIRALMGDYRVICTEWNYNHVGKLPENNNIQEVDGYKQNAQALEKLGSSWIDWRNWDDTTLNEIDTLIFDAITKNYWWGEPVAGVRVTGIKLLQDSVTISWNSTKQLTAIVSPALAENQNIIWTSSDTISTTVKPNGKVTSKTSNSNLTTITATSVDGGFSAICSVNNIKPAQKHPYPQDSIHVIPGVINATYFDMGGEGVGYHDFDNSNNGNGIRQDQAVDTEFRIVEGSIGGIQTGEWLEYTIDVQEEGNYTFEILFATPARSGKFHITINGIDITGITDVRVTGDYNKFRPTTIENIALQKGEQVMRIYFDYAFYNMGTISIKKEGATAAGFEEVRQTVTLYPNPVKDELTISSQIQFQKYYIQSLTGQIVQQGVLYDKQVINTQQLDNGNYIVILIENDFVERKKLIKLN
jgi:hypothetical protein